MFLCEFCGKSFTRKNNLKKHSDTKHGGEILEYNCIICKKKIGDRQTYNFHIAKHLNSEKFALFRSAFNNTTKIFRKTLKDTKSFLQLALIKKDILDLLLKELIKYPKFKLNISITADYTLKKVEGTLVEEFVLKSGNHKITYNDKKGLVKSVNYCFNDLAQREDELNLQGSGWVMEEIKFLDIILNKINILL